MVQYEKVNGIPKLIPSGESSEIKGAHYVDEAGNRQPMPDPADYMSLIKKISGKSPKPKDVAALNNLLGFNPDATPPKRSHINIAVRAVFPPEITYHARYMRELNEIATQFLVDRFQRKASLMANVKQYKEQVDGQTADASTAE